ncbi:DUF3159 domain-containing protein [Arcanobacterium pinnipediorum]|uniref:DUF3159 domain-containing protein n=1 Tax=Arcanobacterium pinnipediorum TaxID=1503041 RepID=A0ABY5AJL5_9ACTO|nr:DUF3159 domain-containing protein [Arcanobacterium pinnipediorum]USR80128.1 DUF3159 domain-containing protein [Arcanobacterium pinnipediorum]
MTSKKTSLSAITADKFDAMQAIGGIRGICESVIPTLVFLVIFALVHKIDLAAAVSIVTAVVAILGRLISRIDPSPAIGGLGAVVISAVMAWRTGQAADFFVWGLIVNVAYLAGLLISILVRWPALGILIGALRSEGTTWRNHKPTMRRYYIVTWLWAGLFLARAAVQLPLYFAGATNALGIAKLGMGIPLFALVAWLSWLMIRGLDPIVVHDDSASQ